MASSIFTLYRKKSLRNLIHPSGNTDAVVSVPHFSTPSLSPSLSPSPPSSPSPSPSPLLPLSKAHRFLGTSGNLNIDLTANIEQAPWLNAEPKAVIASVTSSELGGNEDTLTVHAADGRGGAGLQLSEQNSEPRSKTYAKLLANSPTPETETKNERSSENHRLRPRKSSATLRTNRKSRKSTDAKLTEEFNRPQSSRISSEFKRYPVNQFGRTEAKQSHGNLKSDFREKEMSRPATRHEQSADVEESFGKDLARGIRRQEHRPDLDQSAHHAEKVTTHTRKLLVAMDRAKSNPEIVHSAKSSLRNQRPSAFAVHSFSSQPGKPSQTRSVRKTALDGIDLSQHSVLSLSSDEESDNESGGVFTKERLPFSTESLSSMSAQHSRAGPNSRSSLHRKRPSSPSELLPQTKNLSTGDILIKQLDFISREPAALSAPSLKSSIRDSLELPGSRRKPSQKASIKAVAGSLSVPSNYDDSSSARSEHGQRAHRLLFQRRVKGGLKSMPKYETSDVKGLPKIILSDKTSSSTKEEPPWTATSTDGNADSPYSGHLKLNSIPMHLAPLSPALSETFSFRSGCSSVYSLDNDLPAQDELSSDPSRTAAGNSRPKDSGTVGDANRKSRVMSSTPRSVVRISAVGPPGVVWLGKRKSIKPPVPSNVPEN